MPSFLLATKAGHPLYLVLATYYWIYVRAFENFAKTVKNPSTEFLNLVFTGFVLSTLALGVIDAIVLGVKLIPTAIDCYKDPPNLPLPLECDYGNEKTIFTVTVVVAAVHILLKFLILCLLITIHTGISKAYKAGEGWWYPFFRRNGRRKKQTQDEKDRKDLLTDFQGHIDPLTCNQVTVPIEIPIQQPNIRRFDQHEVPHNDSNSRWKIK